MQKHAQDQEKKITELKLQLRSFRVSLEHAQNAERAAVAQFRAQAEQVLLGIIFKDCYNEFSI